MLKRSLRITAGVALVVLVLLGAGCSAESKMETHFERADAYYENAKYAEAVVEYMNAIKLGGENARAISRIGLAEFARGHLAAALPALKRAVELNPDDREARLKLGSILLLAGENEETRKHAEVIYAKDTNNFEALKLWSSAATTPEEVTEAFRRLKAAEPTILDKTRLQVLYGRLYLLQSNEAAAEQAFKAAKSIDPEFKDPHIILGNLYSSQGRTNLAEQEFESATRVAPTNSLARFVWADFKRKTGEIEESKKLLDQLVAENPQYGPGWYRLAQIAASENNHEDARNKLATLLKQQPDHLPGNALKMRVLMDQGDIAGAVRELEGLTTKYPNYPEFHYLLGVGCQRTGQTSRAIQEAVKATTLASYYPDAELLLAELRIRSNDPRSAILRLEQLRARQPQLVRIYILLGAAYLGSQQFPEAVAAYQKLTELMPDSDHAFYLMGLAMTTGKDREKAFAAFEKALSLNARNFQALTRLIDLSLADKDTQTALRRIQKQMETLPGSVELQLELGRVQLASGNVPQAEAAYRKAIELAPENTGGYLMLSQIQAATERVTDSVKTIEQALEKKPDDLAALTLAGSIYQNRAKDFEKARAVYEKALAIQPESAGALNNLAILCSEQFHEQEKALEYASGAYKLLPANPAVIDTLGWITLQSGNFQYALTLLNQSAELLPDNPEIAYHLGVAQCNTADEAAAAGTLRRAMAENPDFPGADQAALMLSVISINPQQAGPKDLPLLEKARNSKLIRSSALYRLAILSKRQADPQKARAVLEELLDENPDYFPASIELADLLLNQETDLEKALAMSLKAREQAPQSVAAAINVARAAYRQGQFNWAENTLAEAGRLPSGDSRELYALARADYEVGLIDAARRAAGRALEPATGFEQADEARDFMALLTADPNADAGLDAKEKASAVLAKRPGFLPALMVAAAAKTREGETEMARAIYIKILSENPYFAPALKNLFALPAPENPSKQERDLLTRARKLFPNDPYVARAFARLLYERKDYRQAIALFNESNRTIDETAETRLYIGMCQYHLGNRKAAKEELQRAMSLNPEIATRENAGQVLIEMDINGK
ncbi:MAG: tetratricopeptide repeat protein [Verrucomicrobia bacterium]|nr:tetratricopeptide repeat protein [Verrucomicrobiota bacterium]